MNLLESLINANRQGQHLGIYAICSAHPLVLEAAIEQAKADGTPLLIEATANQVNQYGGYTGKTPLEFFLFIQELAQQYDFDPQRIILGGDHLGPVCWQNEPAQSAMAKAHQLIKDYVAAGFKKIHLDCSMPCADDEPVLSDHVVAKRAAALCLTAEQTAKEKFGQSDVLYVIGTEVPPPGGASKQIDTLAVTCPIRAHQTIRAHRQAFALRELHYAWSRVIGLVVQPGVEFDHTGVVDYQSKKAQKLKSLINEVDNIVFEAHSTDYQQPHCYKQLVKDHFAILKVGPQLTFAMREALFALSYIEDYLLPEQERSGLRAVCEAQMTQSPHYWQSFYNVYAELQPMYRNFSYSDRIRYYWPDEKIRKAIDKLFDNIDSHPIPLPLLSQFMPEQYHMVRQGELGCSAKALVKAKIRQVTETYAAATRPQ